MLTKMVSDTAFDGFSVLTILDGVRHTHVRSIHAEMVKCGVGYQWHGTMCSLNNYENIVQLLVTFPSPACGRGWSDAALLRHGGRGCWFW